MFTKRSRYRNLPDVVTTDGQGRATKSRDLRRLPEASGDFLHVVEETDRLDHLAYTYYGQPTKWWRICDANPAFLAPQALLGKEPVVTDRFPLTWEGPMPPWPVLLRALADKVGVEDAGLGTPDQPFPDVQILDGTLLFAIDAGLAADLNAGVLTQEISTALRQALEDGGVALAPEVRTLFVDENNENRWRITDQVSKRIYTFKLESGALNVYDSIAYCTWAVTVTHNEMNVSAKELSDLITKELSDLVVGVDFKVGQPEGIGRVGKRIVIPPNVLG
jgi:hypothetical protein